MRTYFHRGRPVLALGVIVLAAVVAPSAGGQERPDVHSDFRYGVFPYDPAALARFESEEARLLASAFHRGWDVDKYLDETEASEVEALTLLQGFEDDNLVRGRTDYDMRPGFPVLREDELPETRALMTDVAAGLVEVIEGRWDDVEALAASLESGGGLPRDEVLYRIVVGGLLFGGVIDVLFDDQTLMPPPPRRAGRREAYYAWMTEGDAGPPQLVVQSARVGRHQVVSIGPVAADEPRAEIRELAETDPVYEDQDARRWRVFANITARDHVLPYLKSRRTAMMELNAEFDAARYTAFGEFVAWFYLSAATEAADLLTARGRIRPPDTYFRYALLSDR